MNELNNVEVRHGFLVCIPLVLSAMGGSGLQRKYIEEFWKLGTHSFFQSDGVSQSAL